MARGYIVVGIDGSPSSRLALDWALEEAGLRDCSVQVVTVVPREDDDDATVPEAQAATRRDVAAQRQGALIGAALAKNGCTKPLTFKVVEGHPYEVLVDLSTHAHLVVLGSHGVGGLRHSAMGSTSDAVARMSACPVVVIPTHTAPVSTHKEERPVLAGAGVEDHPLSGIRS